jgi:hypothetical protein
MITFIHMLALPAQLLNSFCLSFREKNRSRTVRSKSLRLKKQKSFKMEDHMLPQDSFALYLSFRQTRKRPML